MSRPNRFSYHFYPVGQGLFATGSVRRREERTSRLLWVYDCGTSSSQSLIGAGIERLEGWAGVRQRIDLLVLSHFDHDHISGVCRLLRHFTIGTLMLPYMSLAQRLLVAFNERESHPSGPETDFYLNPVAYLLAQEGQRIERILFVMPSGDQGPPYPGEPPIPSESGPLADPRSDFKPRESGEEDEIGPLLQAAEGLSHATAVEFLRSGSSVTFGTCLWEFIPYNEDPQEQIRADFRRAVSIQRDKLLRAPTSSSRERELAALKMLYESQFGSGSKERNIISLFLYSGPLYAAWDACSLEWAASWSWHSPLHYRVRPLPASRRWRCGIPMDEMRRWRSSILYSGDGYLDSPERLEKLVRYLDERRVRHTGVFQVMHHGSEANWHQGVAASISPLFSVFSSDPGRKEWRHPHAPVLRDFARYRTVQVDKETDFTATGVLVKS
ncbi:MAG: hypothetical protein H7A46_19505 [Verrucomicrobiales bacterium]|nr:hypothetical protein [Verrucomicrobiales bacterium]